MTPLTSSNEVVLIRPGPKSGVLSLAAFAADLYALATQQGTCRIPFIRNLVDVLTELAPAGSEEKALMESISNHVGSRDDLNLKLF